MVKYKGSDLYNVELDYDIRKKIYCGVDTINTQKLYDILKTEEKFYHDVKNYLYSIRLNNIDYDTSKVLKEAESNKRAIKKRLGFNPLSSKDIEIQKFPVRKNRRFEYLANSKDNKISDEIKRKASLILDFKYWTRVEKLCKDVSGDLYSDYDYDNFIVKSSKGNMNINNLYFLESCIKNDFNLIIESSLRKDCFEEIFNVRFSDNLDLEVILYFLKGEGPLIISDYTGYKMSEIKNVLFDINELIQPYFNEYHIKGFIEHPVTKHKMSFVDFNNRTDKDNLSKEIFRFLVGDLFLKRIIEKYKRNTLLVMENAVFTK